MKKIFALGLALLTGSVFAQTYGHPQYKPFKQQEMQEGGASRVPAAAEGSRHMFEFNIDSIEAGALSFDKTKVKGNDAESGSNLALAGNYAYGATTFLQTALRFEYFSGVENAGDQERFNLSVGGIWNFDQDFTRSIYASAYVGMGFAQQFGANSSRDDLRFGSLSLGKRIPLDMFGIKHVVYSPEVSFKVTNSTTDSNLDYAQSLQFKFLQFSVFF
jgi:hypothetical protein